MTPQEFENLSEIYSEFGYPEFKYLENIQTEYGLLKNYLGGLWLSPHSHNCNCYICRGELES